MKERVLFHLRLETRNAYGNSRVNSATTAENEQHDSVADTSASALQKAGKAHCNNYQQGGLNDTQDVLACTCIDSSSESCVVVGYEQGLVHVYNRVLIPNISTGDTYFDSELRDFEEARWKHTTVHPTRAISNSRVLVAPPDITCIQRGPGGVLAVGTSDGLVFITQLPPKDGARSRGVGFHHDCHEGRRVNCLLWDPSGDRLFSVCEGGTVILAKNLKQLQKPSPRSPGGMANMVNSLVPFFGGPSVKLVEWKEPVAPKAFLVVNLGSPGVQLDLGRAKTALPDVKLDCDVLLVMTRRRAVLLYFGVGDDISGIKPYETSVDLNITTESIKSSKDGPGPRSARPPSNADFGGCLWGPPQTGDGSDPSYSSTKRSVRTRGSDALGGEPFDQLDVPRTVTVAYIAQPGGRLWRVGLSDGEVDSTFRPPIMVGHSGEASGAVTGRHVEIGRMQTVHAGASQAIFCWKSGGIDIAEPEGELVLLDSTNHTFVDSCLGLRDVVGFSGGRLADCSKVGSEPTVALADMKLRTVAAVRVLRGGEIAAVTELYCAEEAEEEDADNDVEKKTEVDCEVAVVESAEGVVEDAELAEITLGDTAEELSVERIAARTIQRVWRERRRKRLAAWQASIVPSYNYKIKPTPPSGEASSEPPTNAAVRGATKGRARLGGSFSTNQYERGAQALGVDSRGGDGFSILESLGALDAAERVLRLSNSQKNVSNVDLAVRATSAPTATTGGWSSDEVSKRWLNYHSRSRLGTSNSEGSGGGGSSGSGAEASRPTTTRSLMRATDKLLQETVPVLRRTRSLLIFSPPTQSPLGEDVRTRALEGWDGPGRGMQAAMALAAEEKKVEMLAAATAAAVAAAEVAEAAATKEEEEKDGHVVKDQGVGTDGETPDTAGSEAGGISWDSRVLQPTPTRVSSIPYPGSQHTRLYMGGVSPSATSTMPFPQHALAMGSRRHSSPQSKPHKNLLGPVQNVVGTLLQRSVQAVNDALQPGGGAMSDDDDSSPYDDEETMMFAHEQQGSLEDLSLEHSHSRDDADVIGADGGTTSNTGRTVYSTQFSWDSCRSDYRSDNRSEDEAGIGYRGGSAVTAPPKKQFVVALDASMENEGYNGKTGAKETHGEKKSSGNKKWLLERRMLDIRRQRLATLRSRRKARIKTGAALVNHLPTSALEDPSSFVPPSQYEVCLDVSNGLGLSLDVKGAEVRVTDFPPISGCISPARACGQIQVGDILLRVNNQKLTLLKHNSVVEVLQGLCSHGGQLALLRFQCAERSHLQGQDTLRPPPLPTPPKGTPSTPTRPSTSAAYTAHPAAGSKDDAFRPESWHGSRPIDGGRGSPHARSVSPPHIGRREEEGDGRHSTRSIFTSSPPLDRFGSVSMRRPTFAAGGDNDGKSLSIMDGSSRMKRARSGDHTSLGQGNSTRTKTQEKSMDNSTAPAGSELVDVGLAELGGRDKSSRRRELWGEDGRDGRPGHSGRRHVFVGDMGHYKAHKTLGCIAQDVQGLFKIQDSSQQSRFFTGRSRLSLADPSTEASKNRNPPPSALLPEQELSRAPLPTLVPPIMAFAEETLENGPPPLSPRAPRGRRRRRPRRRRSARSDFGNPGFASDACGDDDGAECGEKDEGVVNIVSCREVVDGELGRLEKELERQQARLSRRDRRSGVDALVAKILLHRPKASYINHSNAGSSEDSISPRGARGRGRKNFNFLENSSSSGNVSRGRSRVGEVEVWGGSNSAGLSDYFSDDTDGDGALGIEAGGSGKVRGDAGRCGPIRPSGDGVEINGGLEGRMKPEAACDVILEAVPTGDMQKEMMDSVPVEMQGVGPPRPLPFIAYDLQTALESVQHIATQTLAGVVHAEATSGPSRRNFDHHHHHHHHSTTFSQESRSRSHSPMRGGGMGIGGGGAGRGGAAAVFAKDQASAAGLEDGWETAWPPRQLTAALTLVTARQMAHAMRCDSEPLIQIWMRCFTPLEVKHRDALWAALSPYPTDSYDRVLGVYHRQLVCGLVTLFAQVHVSWSFLAKPSDDPAVAVGLLSLRLKTSWFTALDVDNHVNSDAGIHGDNGETAPLSPSSGNGEDVGNEKSSGGTWGKRTSGQRGPEQWDERKTLKFIRDYGSYLDADVLACAASCREMAQALHETLRLAAQCQHYKDKEKHLHQLIRGVRTPTGTPLLHHTPVSTPGTRTPTLLSPSSPSFHSSTVSPLAISAAIDRAAAAAPTSSTRYVATRPMEEEAVRKILGLGPARGHHEGAGGMLGRGHRDGVEGMGTAASEGAGDKRGDAKDSGSEEHPPGSAPLCLLLKNLGELFRWDAASAAEMCADAFPGVRPWNVHHALYEDSPWGKVESATSFPAATPSSASVSGRYSVGDDVSTRYDTAFHTYLWATISKQPAICRRDWKMVQRCLQLSLRIGSKLRSLPSSHPLHVFCLAATRNFGGDSCSTGRDNNVASPLMMDSRPGWNNRTFGNRLAQSWQSIHREEGGAGAWEARNGGIGDGSGSACRRYSDIVEEVALMWCQDPNGVSLDPLWLLQKLRVHKNWSIAFHICAALTRSWEEAREDLYDIGDGESLNVSSPHRHSHTEGTHTYGAGLASALTVFDTLAEACFVSFEDGNTVVLSSALGAIWAADGAMRRASSAGDPDKAGRNVGGDKEQLSLWFHGQGNVSRSGTMGEEARRAQAGAYSPRARENDLGQYQGGGGGISAIPRSREIGLGVESGGQASGRTRSEYKGDCDASPSKRDGHDRTGAGIGEPSAGPGGGELNAGSWTRDSRTVDVIWSLMQRCRDYAPRGEEGDGGVRHGGMERGGNRGRGVSMGSESAARDWTAAAALLLVDLAEALADGVGPQAAGDVLAACPCLLEAMPPKFFQGLADRQAALYREQALEATLLQQTMTGVWALGGVSKPGVATAAVAALADNDQKKFETRGGAGSDGRNGASPLGPRLAWLACEELTSFFQQNDNTLPGRGGLGGRSQFVTRLESTTDHAGITARRPWQWSAGVEEVLRHGISRSGLNLLLPGRTHRGTTLIPTSPCAFCGLVLAGTASLSRESSGKGRGTATNDVASSNTGEDLDAAILTCGHGFHVRCMEERVARLTERDGTWPWQEMVGGGAHMSIHMPCAECIYGSGLH